MGSNIELQVSSESRETERKITFHFLLPF